MLLPFYLSPQIIKLDHQSESARKKKEMSDRKLELERKKAKLQAIREEKERRRREKEQLDLEESAAKTGHAGEKDFRK